MKIFTYIVVISIALIMMFLSVIDLFARDRGQYANSTPEIKKWFEGLKSGKGPCCSDADGSALSDVDWQSLDGHYSVRINGEWIIVPDDAVLKVPNLTGRTMVWPMFYNGRAVIRCFIPGSMT